MPGVPFESSLDHSAAPSRILRSVGNLAGAAKVATVEGSNPQVSWGPAPFRMFQKLQVQNADELLENCMQEHGGVSDFNNLAPSKGYDETEAMR